MSPEREADQDQPATAIIEEPADKDRPTVSVRWWENYLVRYFVGTVVGAAIILYFADPSLALLKSSFLKSSQDKSDVAGTGLNFVILIGLGLAYCYASSAPMLTFHAMRAQLDLVRLKPNWKFWTVSIVFALLTWAALILLFSLSWLSKEVLSVALFSIVTAMQIVLILAAHLGKFDRIERFYRDISGVRARVDRRIAEYVESYRHLREHSNAYAIIVLEVILALALVITKRNWQRITILLLWLGPPAYCWLLASILEARYAKSPDQMAMQSGLEIHDMSPH